MVSLSLESPKLNRRHYQASKFWNHGIFLMLPRTPQIRFEKSGIDRVVAGMHGYPATGGLQTRSAHKVFPG